METSWKEEKLAFEDSCKEIAKLNSIHDRAGLHNTTGVSGDEV